MAGTRKRYDAAFEVKVVLEAIRGERTSAEIASETGVYPNRISTWKKQVLEELPGLFADGRKKQERNSSSEFTGVLQDHAIRISMDGRGRAFDNIFVERLCAR